MFKSSRLIIFIALFLSACSSMMKDGIHVDPMANRIPAGRDEECSDLVRYFQIEDEYAENLKKALKEKKLITFTNKFVTINHPRMDWLNRARISLNKSIKNWNNNQYPSFYIFSDEEVVPHAKEYFETISSMVMPDVAVSHTASKNLETVTAWIKSFESYQKDIDDLLDERISLQYNLSILKKLKVKEESQDVRLSYRRDGKVVEEVITLRKSDKNQGYYIKKLKSEIAALDGSLFKNGKIKERVMRQAALMDILTIVQREFEYGVKNVEDPNPELIKELNRLGDILKLAELSPTTYGVYRITNLVFLRELLSLTKLDVAYKKFLENPVLKIKEILDAFIQNRPPNIGDKKNEEEKIGVLKRIYGRISNITLKQASIGGGIAVVGGIGYHHYFAIKGSNLTEVHNDDKDNAEQLERTQEEIARSATEHSEVVEVHINELTK